MATKTDRIEARLPPQHLATIDRAAAMEGVSRSAFVVAAAVEKAEQVIADESITRVPASFFDDLLASLDERAPTPALGRPARLTSTSLKRLTAP